MRRAATYGDRVALVDGDRSLTYSQLDRRSSQFGRLLQSQGAKAGDRVAVFVSNRLEFFEVVIGAWRAGMITVLVNHRLTAKELKYQMADTAAAAIVHSPDLAQFAQQANTSGVPMVTFDAHYESVLAEQPDAPLAVEVDADHPIVLAYTSGTTGKPKGAMQTHSNWHWQLAAALLSTNITSDDRILVAGPLPYIGRALAFSALYRGAPIHILGKFEPVDVLEAIQQHRITATSMVPTMIYMIEELIESEQYDLSSLRTVWYGGAPISPGRLSRLLEIFGPIFVESYGQTEAPSIAFLDREDHVPGSPRLSSVGRPAIGMEISIRDESNQEVAPTVIGELCVRGGIVGAGYWNDAEKTARTIVDGWLHTGDIGYIDEAGYIFIADRRIDMILTGGHNVYPREVEDCISALPAVAEVSVVGVRDEIWGERVTAVLRVKAGATLTERDIDAFCRTHLSGYKIPRAYHFTLQPLPKSANGKVLAREVRVMMEGVEA
ncbi:class I adenylate-forming enzyme family protein [Microbacterium sp. A93]|uniref:class I adenylate-forming enzyme family protein n=1 Tax=Microbacterium sp. A93 TaxID=3450716 RepID=UPI003F429F38